MEIILAGAYCILFYYIIRRWSFFREPAVSSWILPYIFLLKCFSGILLGLLYTYHYTNHNDADSFKFFTDSRFIYESLLTNPYDFFRMLTGIDGESNDLMKYYLQMDSWLNRNPLFNDNKTIIRMNALFRFFSLGYYYVHVIFINFISFTGLVLMYKAFRKFCPGKHLELLLLTFLMPSLIFWGSGLLKDGILIFAFGLMIYALVNLIYSGITTRRVFLFSISLLILMITKVYVILLIIPAVFAWIVSHGKSRKIITLTFIISYVVYLSAAFNLYRIDFDYNVAGVLFYKQKNFIEIGNQHSASMINIPLFECSGPSIMKNAPEAFSITLFRPFITDAHGNPLILLSSFENLFILLLILLCLISFKGRRKDADGFILFCISFVILLFTLIGLITPVLGAIVRYKIIALPCLMFCLVYFYDREKLLSRFTFLTGRNKTGVR